MISYLFWINLKNVITMHNRIKFFLKSLSCEKNIFCSDGTKEEKVRPGDGVRISEANPHSFIILWIF